jgi:allophanate hydrolase subunit 1
LHLNDLYQASLKYIFAYRRFTGESGALPRSSLRTIKETLGSFPCYYSMVLHSILDKCTTQEKAEVLEWWRVTSEAVNRERVRSQVIKLPVIFQDLETLLDVIQNSSEDLAELRKHAYAFKDAVSKVVRRKSRQQKNQKTTTLPEEKLTSQL